MKEAENKRAMMLLYKITGIICMIVFGGALVVGALVLAPQTELLQDEDMQLGVLIGAGAIFGMLIFSLILFLIGNSYLKKHRLAQEDKRDAGKVTRVFFAIFIPVLIILVLVLALASQRPEKENPQLDDILQKDPSEWTVEEKVYMDHFNKTFGGTE